MQFINRKSFSTLLRNYLGSLLQAGGFVASILSLAGLFSLGFMLPLLSVSLYGFGYYCLLCGNLLKTNETKSTRRHIQSATIGILAISINTIAIFFPPLSIISATLLLLSNVLWAKAEEAKIFVLSQSNKELKAEAQKEYYHYSSLMTLVSMVTVFSTVMSIVTTPIYPVTAVISVSLITALSLYASYKWLKSQWVNFTAPSKPNKSMSTKSLDNSHKKMALHMPLIKSCRNAESESLDNKKQESIKLDNYTQNTHTTNENNTLLREDMNISKIP